jgi:hypothetical protein
MTHDERIEAMAIAMMEAEGYWADELDDEKPLYRRMAEAALAAAGVDRLEVELAEARRARDELRELLESAGDMLHECGLRDEIWAALGDKKC